MSRTMIYAIAGIITLGLANIWLSPSETHAQSEPIPNIDEPVFVELFTSQGCSSCPPADRLAASLADEPGLVIISRPVDYWDRLGWKDTFAKRANTTLQRQYARRGLGGYNGVYTPQTVVNGTLGEVGSKRSALLRQVRQESGNRQAIMRVNPVEDRGFAVGLAGSTNSMAELVLIGVLSDAAVDIGRGENRGRTIHYTNVLIQERRIANWTGGRASHAIHAGQLSIPGADRYALVLREPHGGKVLAAQWLS